MTTPFLAPYLLQKYPAPCITSYVNNTESRFTTKYNKTRLRNTRISSFCRTAGVCNRRNPKYDLFRVTTFIYFPDNKQHLHRKAKTWIEQHINAELLEEMLQLTNQTYVHPHTQETEYAGHYGSLCRPLKSNLAKCKPFVPTDARFPTPLQLLQKGFKPLEIPRSKRPQHYYTLPSIK